MIIISWIVFAMVLILFVVLMILFIGLGVDVYRDWSSSRRRPHVPLDDETREMLLDMFNRKDAP